MIFKRINIGYENHITRSVITVAVKQLSRLLNIDSDTFMRMQNSIEDYYKRDKPEVDPDVSPYGNIEVKIDEKCIDTLNIIPQSNERPPFITDPICNVTSNVVHADTELTITYTAKEKSKQAIDKLKNDLALLHSGDNLVGYYDLPYSIPIPEYLLELLFDINLIRNKQLNKSIEYTDYLKSVAKVPLSLVTNMAGKNKTVVIREEQLQCLGIINESVKEIKPEHTTDKSGYWQLELTLTLNYSKPLYIDVAYEPTVYNITLPTEYLISEYAINPNLAKPNQYDSDIIDNTSWARPTWIFNKVNGPVDNIYNIPEFDTFPTPGTDTYYTPLASVLINIDTIDTRTLFKLCDLDLLNDRILEWLKEHNTNDLLKNILSFKLFNKDKQIGMPNLEPAVCEDGTPTLAIRADKELDIHGVYRVVIYTLNDLSVLSKDLISELNTKYKDLLDNDFKLFKLFDNTTLTRFNAPDTDYWKPYVQTHTTESYRWLNIFNNKGE